MSNFPGPIALLGSGETSRAGGRIFEHLARQIGEPLRIAILETPAGFELNSAQIGRKRFEEWCAQLPEDHTVLGLDEHTGILMDFRQQECLVIGVSSVSLVRRCNPGIYPAGSRIPLETIGRFRLPEPLSQGISTSVWEMAQTAPPPGFRFGSNAPARSSRAVRSPAGRPCPQGLDRSRQLPPRNSIAGLDGAGYTRRDKTAQSLKRRSSPSCFWFTIAFVRRQGDSPYARSGHHHQET